MRVNSIINSVSLHLIPICVIIAVFESSFNDVIRYVYKHCGISYSIYIYVCLQCLHQLNVRFCHLCQYRIAITREKQHQILHKILSKIFTGKLKVLRPRNFWKTFQGLVCKHRLTLILARLSNHMCSIGRDEITYSFSNFNSCAVVVWEWVIFIQITYQCWD